MSAHLHDNEMAKGGLYSNEYVLEIEDRGDSLAEKIMLNKLVLGGSTEAFLISSSLVEGSFITKIDSSIR